MVKEAAIGSGGSYWNIQSNSMSDADMRLVYGALLGEDDDGDAVYDIDKLPDSWFAKDGKHLGKYISAYLPNKHKIICFGAEGNGDAFVLDTNKSSMYSRKEMSDFRKFRNSMRDLHRNMELLKLIAGSGKSE